MKNRSNVLTNAGGGGPLLTGTIGESKAYNCHSEQRERAEAQSENHAFRGAVSRESSKTVSESVPRYEQVSNIGQTLKRVQGDNISSARNDRKWFACVGFTMAEILLSLTIIGVVAAITLPSLTGNINERTWNTQRKALYARFSQAIALMPALNGYGTLTEDESGSITEDNVAETFVTSGLAKVLKINNICDSEHLSDCGIPSKITTATGSLNLELDNMTTLNEYNSMFSSTDGSVEFKIRTKAAAFETANGESILIYYNPRCVLKEVANPSTVSFYLQNKLCANFIYDLNGSKGPNTYGKDIGVISAFYPTDSVIVSPNPVVRTSTAGASQMSLANAQKSCREDFDNARLPNLEELMSMAANAPLFGRENIAAGFHSSNIVSSTMNMHVSYRTGLVYPLSNTMAAVWCVNR